MSEITDIDLQNAKTKGVTDTAHLENFNEFEQYNTLTYNVKEIFLKGAWSETLQKYREALQKHKPKRNLKTVKEKQKFENEYEKNNLLNFIEKEKEEEEETEQTPDVFGTAQNKAFLNKAEQNEEVDKETLEMREDFAEFFTLIFDLGIKFGIKKFTKYEFKSTKHTDRRLESLEKTTLKIMDKFNYKPSFWEELGVHFTLYGMDVLKGLELKEKNETNVKQANKTMRVVKDETDERLTKFQTSSNKRKTKQHETKKKEAQKTTQKETKQTNNKSALNALM